MKVWVDKMDKPIDATPVALTGPTMLQEVFEEVIGRTAKGMTEGTIEDSFEDAMKKYFPKRTR